MGVRDLKNHLSRYLRLVRDGDVVIVTDRGSPVAKLAPLGVDDDRLARLVAEGIVREPRRRARNRPEDRIQANGPVSDLVAEQRR